MGLISWYIGTVEYCLCCFKYMQILNIKGQKVKKSNVDTTMYILIIISVYAALSHFTEKWQVFDPRKNTEL